jgi:hypothetical protein
VAIARLSPAYGSIRFRPEWRGETRDGSQKRWRF